LSFLSKASFKRGKSFKGEKVEDQSSALYDRLAQAALAGHSVRNPTRRRTCSVLIPLGVLQADEQTGDSDPLSPTLGAGVDAKERLVRLRAKMKGAQGFDNSKGEEKEEGASEGESIVIANASKRSQVAPAPQ
jgi:hypothetical protein